MCKRVTLFTAAISPRKTCFIQIGFCDFASLFYRRRTSVNRATRFFEGIKDYIVLNPLNTQKTLFPRFSLAFFLAVNIGYISVFYLFFRQRLFYVVSYFKAGTVGIGQNNNSRFVRHLFYAFQYSVIGKYAKSVCHYYHRIYKT